MGAPSFGAVFITRKTLVSTATAAAVLSIPAPAHAQSTGARVLVHLDAAKGQQPENIALEPDGSADLTFAYSGQVGRVSPAGKLTIIAQVPVPADGDVPGSHRKIFLGGLVRAADGTRYVAVSTGTAATGIYRFRPGRKPARISKLPATAFLNGMAADHGRLYVADSLNAKVWQLPIRGGKAKTWATGGPLTAKPGGFGPNGLKVRGGTVWVSNMDAGTLIRFRRPGAPVIVAKDLGPIDDFAFRPDGEVLAAINQESRLTLIGRHGTRTVLTSADGLSNPTSVAVRGSRVYVADAAYFTGGEPNVVISHH